MNYRLARAAARDLRNIYLSSYLRFGPEQADIYAAGLESAFAVIAAAPMIWRERTELARPVRAYRYQSHMILYAIRGSNLVITRIRHGRENWTVD